MAPANAHVRRRHIFQCEPLYELYERYIRGCIRIPAQIDDLRNALDFPFQIDEEFLLGPEAPMVVPHDVRKRHA